ncbi:MAG: thermonuclease family protein [Rickettsiales bacterium]|jgi:endonuclease YncB( thermonuclease family)|nr:thermonuclease family protein [Rickettsiales bacterium]
MMKFFMSAGMTMLLIGTAMSAKDALPRLNAEVVHIIDGDTFVGNVRTIGGATIRTKVRFINIDAPELSGECESEVVRANAAKDRLSEIIPVGSIVELTHIQDDKYRGRIDAFVVKNGADIGSKMIMEGHAVPYSGGKRQPWCN